MAGGSRSARRLRWLALAGLAGAGLWIVKSRRPVPADPAERWETTPWPAPPVPVVAAPDPVAVGETGERAADTVAPATRPAPVADDATPPLGVPLPTPAATAGPEVELRLMPVVTVSEAVSEAGGAQPAAAVRPSPTPRRRPSAPEYGPGSAPAGPDGSPPGPDYTIKGNAGSMLFHRPDSPYYGRTRAEVWFRTATDARAAGFTDWDRRRRDADPSASS
jgi:hypothetical protein